MFLQKKESDTRPLILVTGPDRVLKFGWWAVRHQLWRAGARSKYMSPKRNQQRAKNGREFDAIVISGGDDIDPKHYGSNADAGANYDPARDQMEMEMIGFALERNLPMLGICRGAQLINVVRGGNLFDDLRPLRKKTPNKNTILPIKNATISADSRLNKILQKTKLCVNSLHHQAVKHLGENLIAVAHDDDGFMQAIEDPQHPFLIGVQWHPEYMPFHKPQQNLFNFLVRAAKQRAVRPVDE